MPISFGLLPGWWWAIDGYNVNRGIDRLIYIPNLGIVGGSYDFYFELKPRAMYDNVIPLPVDEENYGIISSMKK